MNRRDRLLAAVHRKEVDRIPTTFRASKYLTIRMMEHFGFERPDDFNGNRRPFLDRLGADFWSSGTKVDKFSTFIPAFNGPLPQPPYVDDGTYFYTIGIRAKPGNMKSWDIDYPHVGVDPPLAASTSASDIERNFLTSKLDLFDFSRMRNKYRGLEFSDIEPADDDVVCIGTLSSLFMICCYMRGMESFLMDMVFDRKMTERIIGEVGEFCLEFNRRELASIGESADYYGTWDDVAGQNGMIFSPELFRRYFLPLYKKLIEQNKKYDLDFGWHCCGNVHEVMPMMIDAGIDVFDVVQTSALHMDIETVYRRYGGNVCIHGGLDVQKLLVEKSAEEVAGEVKRIVGLWNNRGGVILAPSHETLPDTPIENIIAIYETLRGM
jgi:uroporphyrinogen-III decarboxylase